VRARVRRCAPDEQWFYLTTVRKSGADEDEVVAVPDDASRNNRGPTFANCARRAAPRCAALRGTL
jgi:hypothetical protein